MAGGLAMMSLGVAATTLFGSLDPVTVFAAMALGLFTAVILQFIQLKRYLA